MIYNKDKIYQRNRFVTYLTWVSRTAWHPESAGCWRWFQASLGALWSCKTSSGESRVPVETCRWSFICPGCQRLCNCCTCSHNAPWILASYSFLCIHSRPRNPCIGQLCEVCSHLGPWRYQRCNFCSRSSCTRWLSRAGLQKGQLLSSCPWL